MADEETTEAPPRKGSVLVTALVALGGLAVGAGAGVFAIGPMLGSGSTAEAGGSEGGGHGGGGGGGHGESSGGDAALYAIDNLVVNPAGSQGTRFLVAGLAVRLTDASSSTSLQARDPEIRDALLGLLASQTVAQLSDPTVRDQLKQQFKAAIEAVIGEGTVASVLIPQFVLQ